MTRSSLACTEMGSSLISSRKIVPLLAISNRPCLPSRDAPVKAPFAWPNSSLSMRFSGSVAQLMATKASFFRLLALWMLWAKTSLPVPVSPQIRMALS